MLEGGDMPITYDFQDRVAIVTGGSKGIGRCIAERLRDAGAQVIVWDIVPPEFEGVSFSEVNVSDRGSITRGVAQLTAAGRAVHILVNNAGVAGPSTPVLRFDPDTWHQIVEVNLISIFEVCRQVVPLMEHAGSGRVVNMASLAGKDGTPLMSAYAAAKAGIIAFTKSFGKELAHTDIRVNCVAPAAIETDILRQLSPEAVRRMIEISPMKRLGTVEEVSDIVLFLCSEACSFSTGASFDASGGRAVY
jgi:NAD(P)-dependent dehydrogenase (short-subunit alcohol dehydrogenase family)